MDEAKILFSVAEMELMNNANIILTKNKIMEKVRTMLEELQLQMVEQTEQTGIISHPLFLIPPKISRGENYSGLPYLILDYPRRFNGSDQAAIRSMFWWGHFFSSTLHLSGKWKMEYLSRIEKGYPALTQGGYYINMNEDQWQHHFGAGNYMTIKDLTQEQFCFFCQKYEHIKIAAKWPLNNIHFSANELWKTWQFFINLVI